jgi:hypothetical protein
MKAALRGLVALAARLAPNPYGDFLIMPKNQQINLTQKCQQALDDFAFTLSERAIAHLRIVSQLCE